MGKMQSGLAAGYVISQFVGATVGALPLLLWGSMGRSVAFGSTLPGQGYSLEMVLLEEVVTTFGLVAGLCVFLGFRKLLPFTPWLFPFLYALMVYVEAPISGTPIRDVCHLDPGYYPDCDQCKCQASGLRLNPILPRKLNDHASQQERLNDPT
jgi:aquaporin Z